MKTVYSSKMITPVASLLLVAIIFGLALNWRFSMSPDKRKNLYIKLESLCLELKQSNDDQDFKRTEDEIIHLLKNTDDAIARNNMFGALGRCGGMTNSLEGLALHYIGNGDLYHEFTIASIYSFTHYTDTRVGEWLVSSSVNPNWGVDNFVALRAIVYNKDQLSLDQLQLVIEKYKDGLQNNRHTALIEEIKDEIDHRREM